MVTVNSPSADAEAELLYPAGVDVSVAAGSTSGSDSHIADESTSAVVTTGVQHNNLPRNSVTELPDNGELNVNAVGVDISSGMTETPVSNIKVINVNAKGVVC